MNSKEALEMLKDNVIDYLGGTIDKIEFMFVCLLYEIIKQDLDKLEKIKSLPNCDICDSNWHKGCMCLKKKIIEVLGNE